MTWSQSLQSRSSQHKRCHRQDYIQRTVYYQYGSASLRQNLACPCSLIRPQMTQKITYDQKSDYQTAWKNPKNLTPPHSSRTLRNSYKIHKTQNWPMKTQKESRKKICHQRQRSNQRNRQSYEKVQIAYEMLLMRHYTFDSRLHTWYIPSTSSNPNFHAVSCISAPPASTDVSEFQYR